jgi:hypothetical protein
MLTSRIMQKWTESVEPRNLVIECYFFRHLTHAVMTLINVEQLIERPLTGETKVFRRKHTPVPFCPQQISHDPTLDWELN